MPFLAVTFSLLGIALGSSPAALRPTLGDPLLVERTSTLSRTADYLRGDDISAVLRVTERDGVVFAVEIERERPEASLGVGDEYGARLGMQRSAVEAKRGAPAVETANTLIYPDDRAQDASTIYRFDGDLLEGIKLVGSGTSAAGNATLPHVAETAGDGYADAILDLSPTVPESDHFRDRYLTVHGCDAAGRSSTRERRDGKTYVIAGGTCDGKKRSFYFDVTRARP